MDVTNTGKVSGSEVVQIYVFSPKENIHKPLRELKGFNKVNLKSKETKTVKVILNKEELKFWDINKKIFVLETGEYIIQVGKNSKDIVLEEKISLKGEKVTKTHQEIYDNLDFENLTDEKYEEIWNIKIPTLPPTKPITLESRLFDLKATFFGRILLAAILSVPHKALRKANKMKDGVEKDNEIKGAQSAEKMILTSTLTTISMASSGMFPYNYAVGFKEIANGHLIKGVKAIFTKIKAPKLQ